MQEVVKWAVFVIYSALYWMAMAAGILITVAVAAAIWDTLRGR